MVTPSELQKLANDGKQEFEAGQYEPAVDKFEAAAEGYASLNDKLNAAEMKNNVSVALLKLGQGQAALDAVLGTDQVFARASEAGLPVSFLGGPRTPEARRFELLADEIDMRLRGLEGKEGRDEAQPARQLL